MALAGRKSLPQELGGTQQVYSSTGILINVDTQEQVDLFIIETENFELRNNLTDENTPSAAKINQNTYVEFRPTSISIDGQLVPNKYIPSDMYETYDHMPVDKLNTLMKFCNDATSSYKLVCPALPFTFISLFPTNLSVNAEGKSNAVNFSLDLEEIGLSKKLPRRQSIKKGGASPQAPQNAGVVGGGATDPGSGSNEQKAGKKEPESLVSKLIPDNPEEAVERVAQGYDFAQKLTSKGATAAIGGKVGKMLGATAGEQAQALFGAGPMSKKLGSQLGQAIGKQLGGASFTGISSMTKPLVGAVENLKDIPIIGSLAHNIIGLPGDTELLLEVERSNKKTTLMTMRSPVFSKLRNKILDSGFSKIDVPDGLADELVNKKVLTAKENRNLGRAFVVGIEELGLKYKNHSSLRDFITDLPPVEEPEGLTFYNHYGQPVMSFEGFISTNFNGWNSFEIDLNGQDVVVEHYWNRTGFPVFSFSQKDGTPLTKEIKGTLGSDLLNPLQGLSGFSGTHIIPVSLTGQGEITKESLGDTVEFMLCYTNKKALDRVL